MIIEVKRGGDLAVQTGAAMQGTIEIAGNEWRLDHRLYQSPPSGTYRVRGDELSVNGALFDAQLERVACGKRPNLQPPYEISRDIEGAMRPTTRLAPQIRPPASQSLDEKLVGLWRGPGRARRRRHSPETTHVSRFARLYGVRALRVLDRPSRG